MHKPLQDNRWTRFKLLVRGLLFYNTVYWKRASDGLNPPRLSSEERKIYAPPKDFDVIRPRAKPRARIDVQEQRRREEEIARLRLRVPPALASQLRAGKALSDPALAALTQVRAPAPEPAPGSRRRRSPAAPVTEVKRRRKHRPPRVPMDGEAPSAGFVARLFEKWL